MVICETPDYAAADKMERFALPQASYPKRRAAGGQDMAFERVWPAMLWEYCVLQLRRERGVPAVFRDYSKRGTHIAEPHACQRAENSA